MGKDVETLELESLPGVDLGGGAELSAVEVVESHFNRLVASCADPNDEDAEDVSSVDTDRIATDSDFSITSLRTAINNLAPHLLPIVQIAEDIANATPVAPPAKEFRLLLNDALLAEHKQQINKKTIGIQAPEEDEDLIERIGDNKYALLASLPVAATLAFSLWYLNRTKREPLHSDSN